MDQPLTKEESYAERRELFKNIWETAMHISAKDPDIIIKPKVIKTLRLDEVDRCITDKRKKQRIKNLRTVCNKILQFCDTQDADNRFYEQIKADGQILMHGKLDRKLRKKTKHLSPSKVPKNILTPPNDCNQAKMFKSKKQDNVLLDITKRTSRNTSPIKIKGTPLAKKAKENAKIRYI